MLRTLTLVVSWAKLSNKKSLFYNKVLNFSCSLLNTVLKVKIRVVVWVQKGCECMGCLPSWLHGWLGGHGSWPLLIRREYLLHIAGLRKGQNSQFHVQFLLNVYCFCTIVKSRNYKLNHHKIGDCLYSSLKARENSLLFHKNVESNFEWVSS